MKQHNEGRPHFHKTERYLSSSVITTMRNEIFFFSSKNALVNSRMINFKQSLKSTTNGGKSMSSVTLIYFRPNLNNNNTETQTKTNRAFPLYILNRTGGRNIPDVPSQNPETLLYRRLSRDPNINFYYFLFQQSKQRNLVSGINNVQAKAINLIHLK